MFKRIDRRLKRKAEQEELGIDGDLKEQLGLVTDSDESESDSDSDGEGQGESSDADNDVDAAGSDNEGIEEEDGEEQDSDSEEEDDGGSSEDENTLDRSVAEVLENPLFLASEDPPTTLCSVCPGKILTTVQAVETHSLSKHHIRRYTQFAQRAASSEDREEESAIAYVPDTTVEATRPEGLSKREEKRLKQKAHQAQKRKEKKAAFLERKSKRKTDANEEGKPKKATPSAQKQSPTKSLPSTKPNLPSAGKQSIPTTTKSVPSDRKAERKKPKSTPQKPSAARIETGPPRKKRKA
ncbi:hypothetical protein CYLTODRAFT_445638 [Cylindrobasidium torrendii FP15055 ss-10]|uniref:Uncharacterized protein n=1 Tax=Cylindrobasidium torrendii FP15055 ss-10 TaxID=1314674 RepID=A0A0D7B3C7_9AGAR|nr:hypothetical protein CYLTODRAFT_445638 [Cylindrobasidium torrendii FP15055 ss-10]